MLTLGMCARKALYMIGEEIVNCVTELSEIETRFCHDAYENHLKSR